MTWQWRLLFAAWCLSMAVNVTLLGLVARYRWLTRMLLDALKSADKVIDFMREHLLNDGDEWKRGE